MEPLTHGRNRVMVSMLQLSFNSFDLGHQPLLRRFPPYGERLTFPALPAIVRETQKREGLRLSLPSPFAVLRGEPPSAPKAQLLARSMGRMLSSVKSRDNGYA
jgi:hypothetical protein